jgi:PPP family 3-phenylpropionic acid transporter
MQNKREAHGRSADARAFALRLSLFFAASFFLVGTFSPYMPVWLDGRGLTAGEIGVVMATPLFVRIAFTPAISFLADRAGNRRAVLIALTGGALASCLALFGARSFWPILLAATLYAVFWTTVIPLTEAVAMTGVRAFRLDYGRMRLWGSIAFIGASLAGGLAMQAWGSRSVLWVLTLAALLTLLAAVALPMAQAAGEAAARPARGLKLADALALARAPLFLLFVAAVSLVQASHAILYAFGSLHFAAQGISGGTIGALWAIGVAAEIVLFLYSGAAVSRLGPVGLIAAGALAALVRWPLMALDPPLWALVPLMMLHGATFGAAHLGAIHFIAAAVPESHSATAQGLHSTLAGGLVMGLAMMSAGPLYAGLGSNAFLAMGIPAVLAIAACALLAWLWDGKPIVGAA